MNQIRTWVRQGRTDAWIAHQLEVTGQQIEAFKKENDLGADADVEANGVDFDDEIDLRAEDDAQIAAELEAEQAAKAAEEERRAAQRAARDDDEEAGDEDEDGGDRPRRRGRRGGRGRSRRTASPELEGTFDHGEEGYGLWLDPAVADNAVYAEHWAGHRGVTVVIEEDQIVIRRAGDDADDED